MKIIRFRPTESGSSCFDEIDLPIDNASPNPFDLINSVDLPSTSVTFSEMPAGKSAGFHNSPQPTLCIVVRGTMEVTTGDGQTRKWSAGEFCFADDPVGKGHATRALGGPTVICRIRLAKSLDLKRWAV